MQERWRAKETITGGKGKIPKGTLLILESKSERKIILRRETLLPEGPNIQNRIIMHLPALWDEFLEKVND